MQGAQRQWTQLPSPCSWGGGLLSYPESVVRGYDAAKKKNSVIIDHDQTFMSTMHSLGVLRGLLRGGRPVTLSPLVDGSETSSSLQASET